MIFVMMTLLACVESVDVQADTDSGLYCSRAEVDQFCRAGQEVRFPLSAEDVLLSVEGCQEPGDCLPLHYHRESWELVVYCTRNDSAAVVVFGDCEASIAGE